MEPTATSLSACFPSQKGEQLRIAPGKKGQQAALRASRGPADGHVCQRACVRLCECVCSRGGGDGHGTDYGPEGRKRLLQVKPALLSEPFAEVTRVAAPSVPPAAPPPRTGLL